MFGKLIELEKRFEEIEAEMAKPEVLSNMEEYKKLAKERTDLKEVSTPTANGRPRRRSRRKHRSS